MSKLRKRYGVDYVEVRVIARKDKDEKLFNDMKKFPEVLWSEVAKKGIENYISERQRGLDNA